VPKPIRLLEGIGNGENSGVYGKPLPADLIYVSEAIAWKDLCCK